MDTGHMEALAMPQPRAGPFLPRCHRPTGCHLRHQAVLVADDDGGCATRLDTVAGTVNFMCFPRDLEDETNPTEFSIWVSARKQHPTALSVISRHVIQSAWVPGAAGHSLCPTHSGLRGRPCPSLPLRLLQPILSESFQRGPGMGNPMWLLRDFGFLCDRP